MGQADILDWLKEKRLAGDNGFFSRLEIEREMVARGLSVERCRAQLNQLYVYHFLDVELGMQWKRRYRLKKKYVVGARQ